MATVQSMEEELQQSVMLSEEEIVEPIAGGTKCKSPHAQEELEIPRGAENDVQVAPDDGNDERGHTMSRPAASIDDEDLEGEEEDSEGGIECTEAEESGEDDDGDGSAVEDDGVGAVKIRPRKVIMDEEGIDEFESEDSEAASGAEDESEEGGESEEEAAWEEADGVEEEEPSEVGANNNCIFCRQDEDHDPSEEFESFLACKNCGDHAHQQCAREAAAIHASDNPRRWRCLDCRNDDSEDDESEEEVEGEEEEQDTAADIGSKTRALQEFMSLSNDRPLSSRSERSDIPKIARNLLPPHIRSVDPNSHSVFNELLLNEDPMDGSRLLRKRKSSSLEDAAEDVADLRRRRRKMIDDVTSAIEDADEDDGSEDEDDDNDADGDGLSDMESRPQRLQLEANQPHSVTLEKKSRTKMIVRFLVKPTELRKALGRKRRYVRKAFGTTIANQAAGSRDQARSARVSFIQTPFTTDSYTQPFYSFFDKDTDGANGKPYGGILTETEADTSKTLPLQDDRKRFDQAKQKAEDEWRARILATQAEAKAPPRKKHKVSVHASQIECIEFGGWEIDTWYAAPYPAEYSRNRVLYICEFCLKYMNSDYVAWRHKLKCATKHPPGDEIYRHRSVSLFEVDGRKNPVYCQNLCLLAKLFLGSKTLYYDVEPFLFYILCEYDDHGYHFVGYFSKEKRASSQNNVSCILTLPIHQRKGYGNLLIDFSYLLTKAEGKTGSPEKPLSDMGLLLYRNYWRLILCQYFLTVMSKDNPNQDGLSIREISDDTGMTPDDVVSALERLRALVRDPQTKLYAFRIDLDYCRDYVAKWEAKKYVTLKPQALAWTPYVMGRSNVVNFELGPPISTVAPREDEEAKLDEGLNGLSTVKQPPTDNQPADLPRDGRDDVDDNYQLNTVRSIEEKEPDDKASADEEQNVVGGETQGDLGQEDASLWADGYKGIPPTRFEVFPAIAQTRRSGTIVKHNASRPYLQRATTTSHRPKRVGRRSTASRPRASGSRRRTGGTGRGPGRWPKGTKKSDYGNADSGPGLPPGWNGKQKESQGSEGSREGDLAEDEVRVSVPLSSPSGLIETMVRKDVAMHDVDAEGEEDV